MFPWGTPEWMWKRFEVSSLIFSQIGLHLGTISADLNSLRVEFF